MEWKADSLYEMATSGLFVWKKGSTTQLTNCMKGWKIINTQMTPNTLNTKWANAARLAWVLAVSAARLAVMVVPIFSPSTSAAPSSRLIQPLAHMINVIAMVAADACTIMVNMVPINS